MPNAVHPLSGIEYLGLSARTADILRSNGIATVGQLGYLYKNALIRLKRTLFLVPEAIEEIGEALESSTRVHSQEAGCELEEDDYRDGLNPTVADYLPLTSLKLSIRTRNALKRSGITTVEQLYHLFRSQTAELRKIRNIGARSMAEIKEVLESSSLIRELELASQLAVLPSPEVRYADRDPEAGSQSTKISLQDELELQGHLLRPISTLELSLTVRTYRTLCRNGIETINQLCDTSRGELREFRNLGVKMMDEIEQALVSLWHTLPAAAFAREFSNNTVNHRSVQRGRFTNHETAKTDSCDEKPPPEKVAAVRNMLVDMPIQSTLSYVGVSLDLLPIPANISKPSCLCDAEDSPGVLGDLFLHYANRANLHLFPSGQLARQVKGSLNSYLEQFLATILEVSLEPCGEEPAGTLRLVDLLALLLLPLDRRKQRVMCLRFGLQDGLKRTLDETAKSIGGVTRERARQVESQALKRTGARAKQIKPLLVKLLEPYLSKRKGVATAEELADDLRTISQTSGICPEASLRFLIWQTGALAEIGAGIYTLPCDAATGMKDALESMQDSVTGHLIDEHAQIEFAELVEHVVSSDSRWPRETIERLASLAILSQPDLTLHEDGSVGHKVWAKKWTEDLVRAMRGLGRPVHFSQAAAETTSLLPTGQRVDPRKVRAYMGRRPDLFVRLGGGKYGLVEWGLLPNHSVLISGS